MAPLSVYLRVSATCAVSLGCWLGTQAQSWDPFLERFQLSWKPSQEAPHYRIHLSESLSGHHADPAGHSHDAMHCLALPSV